METASETSEGLSISQVCWQCLLMCLVFYLWYSPVIQPVKIMVVLFHEMSHGLMAVASGGRVLQIGITAEEGGACETEGGIPLLIVSAGYLGSMFFGGLLLYLSRFRRFVPIVYTLLTLTVAGAIFTVLHDHYSRTFATALAASFIFMGLLAPGILGALFLQLLGTVSCLYSIFDIYWDVLASGRSGTEVENDAAAFAGLTGVSSQTIGALWLAASVVYFLCVLKLLVRQLPGNAPEEGKAASAQA
jgi:hypothetical protein